MSAQPHPAPPDPRSLPVVLLVEDDADDAFLTERALKNSGVPHRVIRLHDGEEAIKYLSCESPYHNRDAYPVPDIILMDIKMPKATGLDVLTWLQKQPDLSSIPVIVLTGSILPSDREEAKKLGAVGFEVKPVDFSVLVSMVQGIGVRWLKQPKAPPPA
jgi:CheY-like chemotaxis protein